MLTRRRFLATLAFATAGVFGYSRWIEPARLSVTTNAIGDPQRNSPPMRLVQLTDLHLQRVGRHEEAVAEALHDLSPDVLVVTGDSIDRSDNLHVLAEFIEMLPESPHAFATLGNWEHWSGVDRSKLRATYASRGIRLLVNESVALRHAGRRGLITGLDDATGGRPDLRSALRDSAAVMNHIILAHSPAFRDHLEGAPVPSGFSPECMLSGHTHGGQVNLAGWAPMRPPGSGRYVAGWYRDKAPHLYVSRGIGTSVLPIRLGAPPEIAVFDWHLRA